MSTLKIKKPKKPRKAVPNIMGPAEEEITKQVLNSTFSSLTSISETHGAPALLATALGMSFAIGYAFQSLGMTEDWIKMQKQISQDLIDRSKELEKEKADGQKPV